MTKRLFALVLSLMLAVALTACTSGDDKVNDGTADNTTTQNNTARTRTTQHSTHTNSSANRGRYFADAKGDVRDDRTDWVGDDVRRAADDMMDGARRVADDVMDGVRRVGDATGDTIRDMTE